MALLEPGAVIAGYRIEAIVGRGGMGVVYRARELALDRVVALKLIAPELIEEPVIRERFLLEARTAAAIEHPHVIPVHAAGEEEGVAYLAMRFVIGTDLRTRVKRDSPLAPELAAELIAHLGDALDAIHRAGYVHRDVKPANVLVAADGHIYLTDFGLAKQTLTHAGATATGQWVGTLDYIAPEQIRGGAVDARTDVYALGGVLHFALTGDVPYPQETDEAKLWAQLNEPPPVPSQRCPELPRAFDAVVARAMAKAPDDRYPSAGDLARATRAALSGEAPSQPERMVARGAAAPADHGEAPTVSAAAPPRPRRGRGPLIAAGLVVVAAAAAVAAVLIVPGGKRPSRSPARPHTPAPQIFHVGHRPNGVAVAGGVVWVTSSFESDVQRVDAATRRVLAPVKVGPDAASIAPDGDGVWIALKSPHQVVRVDGTGKVTRHLSPPGAPTRVAVGLGSIWVAVSGIGGADLLVRYGSDGRERGRTPIVHGIIGLTVGQGYVWIAETTIHRVLRLDPRNGKLKTWAGIADAISDLYDGGGLLWATLAGAGNIVRVSPAKPATTLTTSIGHRPLRSVAAGGRVYVTVNIDHDVARVDPATGERAGRAIPVPPNPYAITADSRALWVTGTANDTLTPIPLS